MSILEYRMQRGELCIIDAVNSKATEINSYRNLADKYRYRIICVDMTDIPKEVCKERNSHRPSYSRVPDEAIENIYSRFETQKIPSGIKVIKPNEVNDVLHYKPIDLSNYNKIVHIGDIHGCFTALKEYFGENLEIKDDQYYIFTGDYLDRGIENASVMKFLLSIMNKSNVLFLNGNHERYLWNFANEEISYSKVFERFTKIELLNAEIKRKDIRIFYRKLGQCAYYTYGDKIVFVNHGGLPILPNELQYISTEQLIYGVGDYIDSNECDDNFVKSTADNVYQIHGHRNELKAPIQVNERCFNLEGQVEMGGHLRIVELSKEGFNPIEIKNTVFRAENVDVNNSEYTNLELITLMKDNPMIRRNKISDHVSSFNFTSGAFKNRQWNSQTIKARGLFMNTDNGDVVARSYEKFFNLNERKETKLNTIKANMTFPSYAYLKYNGFLGIVGYDAIDDDLFISSKSTTDSVFAEWFKLILWEKLETVENLEKFKNYLKENNKSVVFEVIDPKHDSHIIEYKNKDIIALALIDNNIKFKQDSYEDLVEFATSFNLSVKERVAVFNNIDEFDKFYEEVIKDDYTYDGEYIEGFVIENSEKPIVKLKLSYYSFWKNMRTVLQKINKYGYYDKTSALRTPLSNKFHGWLRNQPKEKLENMTIIEARNKFYEEGSNK